jgi:predicted RNA-binding protein YlqC (UPF0109 family)
MDPVLSLLKDVLPHLVDTPDELSIVVDDNLGDYRMYLVRTKPGEEGQVIGKAGAIRTNLQALMRSAAMRHNTGKVQLEVVTN